MRENVNLKLIHHTKNRARFRYACAKGENLESNALHTAILGLENVVSVRINSVLNDIIITYSKDLKGIEKSLYALLQKA